MSNITILYTTDNCLDPTIAELCKRYLLKAIDGKRLITVSQHPLNFGDNICVGSLGRSGFSIERQLEAGLKAVQTRYVAIAEHDCIYTAEHFNAIPQDDQYFYYNTNCWWLRVQAGFPNKHGLFSYTPKRHAQSQLIANTDLMREATAHKMSILSDPIIRSLYPTHSRICEPGVDIFTKAWKVRTKRIFKNQLGHLRTTAIDYITKYVAKSFTTIIPTIDIRHGNNFTGNRMGRVKSWSLEPWGVLQDIFKNVGLEP